MDDVKLKFLERVAPMYFCSTRRSSDEGMWEETVVARETGLGEEGERERARWEMRCEL